LVGFRDEEDVFGYEGVLVEQYHVLFVVVVIIRGWGGKLADEEGGDVGREEWVVLARYLYRGGIVVWIKMWGGQLGLVLQSGAEPELELSWPGWRTDNQPSNITATLLAQLKG
jgi:hypothetical protein